MKPQKPTWADRIDRIKRYMGEGTENKDVADRLIMPDGKPMTVATLINIYKNHTKPRSKSIKSLVALEIELGIES